MKVREQIRVRRAAGPALVLKTERMSATRAFAGAAARLICPSSKRNTGSVCAKPSALGFQAPVTTMSADGAACRSRSRIARRRVAIDPIRFWTQAGSPLHVSTRGEEVVAPERHGDGADLTGMRSQERERTTELRAAKGVVQALPLGEPWAAALRERHRRLPRAAVVDDTDAGLEGTELRRQDVDIPGVESARRQPLRRLRRLEAVGHGVAECEIVGPRSSRCSTRRKRPDREGDERCREDRRAPHRSSIGLSGPNEHGVPGRIEGEHAAVDALHRGHRLESCGRFLDGRLDGDDDLEADESPRAGRRGGAPTPAQVFSPTWWW